MLTTANLYNTKGKRTSKQKHSHHYLQLGELIYHSVEQMSALCAVLCPNSIFAFILQN